MRFDIFSLEDSKLTFYFWHFRAHTADFCREPPLFGVLTHCRKVIGIKEPEKGITNREKSSFCSVLWAFFCGSASSCHLSPFWQLLLLLSSVRIASNSYGTVSFRHFDASFVCRADSKAERCVLCRYNEAFLKPPCSRHPVALLLARCSSFYRY